VSKEQNIITRGITKFLLKNQKPKTILHLVSFKLRVGFFLFCCLLIHKYNQNSVNAIHNKI